MKEKIVDFLLQNVKYDLSGINLLDIIEKPKKSENGDFSLPCFIMSKDLKESPQNIANEIANEFLKKLPDFLSDVKVMGGFVNFYANYAKQSESVINEIIDNSFKNKIKIDKTQKILIEYPSPNTNKALHLGHSRNILLGNALTNMLKKAGHNVIRANLNNDRGIAVCKTMLAYKLFANNKSPTSENKKPDHFVADLYVLYGQKNTEYPLMKLDEKAQEMLVLWEKKDKETLDLWNKILAWVLEGYKDTYKRYKLPKFDKEYFESDIYDKGKDIIESAVKKGVKGFKKGEGSSIYFDFEDDTYGKKYLLRKDGTTIYMTQDIYLAYQKMNDFSADKYIFIVANEQGYHFEVLFKILESLGFGDSNKNYHFGYGMIYDKDGNVFSSRLGNTIGADDILDMINDKALTNLKIKNKNMDDINSKAETIAYTALTFNMLKVNPLSDINFDIEKSLSFEGETGPYCLYTYARINSILEKSDDKILLTNLNVDFSLFGELENSIVKMLKEYPETVIDACIKYKPSSIINYMIRLCQLFNEFYQNENILKSDEQLKNGRLLILKCIKIILDDAFEIFNIKPLKSM